MDEIDKLINSLEEKEKSSFEDMELLIDSVDNLIQQTNTELLSENNKDDSKTREILSKKETELKKLKLIPKMNRICNSYYHKYKEVNKKIDDNIKGVNYLNNKNLTKFIGNVDEKLIKEIILDHLIRKGNIKTVERFIDEGQIDSSKLKDDIKIFKEYYYIINDLNNHKLDKLYEWCVKNKDILLKDIEEINLNENNKIEKNKKSKEKNLYFECVKYNYILYLQDETKSILDCINYSRKYFKPFIFDKNYINEISKLMVKLLYRKADSNNININTEKKDYIFDNENQLEEIKNLFIDKFLKFNHKSKDDTLSIILLAGRCVLPQVVESEEKLMKDKDPKNIEGDKEKNTLMYSLELPEELIFHNIFVCPISKETATKENPPIRLNCGHCICKNSFEKIEKTGTRHNQIKCPICTQVGKIDEITNLIIK
jgi:hypothetical protein